MHGYKYKENKSVIHQRYQHTSLLNIIKTKARNICLETKQNESKQNQKTKGFHSKSHFVMYISGNVSQAINHAFNLIRYFYLKRMLFSRAL